MEHRPKTGFDRFFRFAHCKEVQYGFTLAEVLITLGIIGVVAALVLPGMIEGYEKRVISTGFTKTYAVLSRLAVSFEEEYGPCERKSESGYAKVTAFNDYLTKNLKLRHCNNNYANDKYFRYIKNLRVNGEFSSKTTTDAGGYNGSLQYPSDLLCSPDGIIYTTMGVSGGTNYITGTTSAIGMTRIDVNGLRGPNVMFKDIFYFVYIPFSPVLGTSVPPNSYYTTYSSNPQRDFYPIKILPKEIRTSVIYPAGYGLENEPKMGCKEKRDATCALKIISNGGTISKDYPWKKGASTIYQND